MEDIRKAIEKVLDDSEPRTVEEQLVVIGILQKLTDNPGSTAVEEICHIRDLMGMPWPSVEECNQIARKANEEAARSSRGKEPEAE